MAVLSTAYQNIARAVSAYSVQKRTDAVRLIGTDLVGTDARINVNAEDHYGSIRWFKQLGDLDYGTTLGTNKTQINIATETDDEGIKTGFTTDISEFIKTYRTFGADEYNVTKMLTGSASAIEYVGGQLSLARVRDEDAALRAVIEGVVAAEVKVGEANGDQGGQISADALEDVKGFYVDLGATKLVDSALVGAKGAKGLIEALAFGWSDLDVPFVYLLIQPSTLIDMQLLNLIDEDRVTDGNLEFSTILNGKVRLINSREGFAAQNGSSAVTGVKTSILMLPSSVSYNTIAIANPVAFDRDESVGRGAGSVEMWGRWSYALTPYGYTWAGSKIAFASNTTMAADTAWTRKETVGNLGILPVFHA